MDEKYLIFILFFNFSIFKYFFILLLFSCIFMPDQSPMRHTFHKKRKILIYLFFIIDGNLDVLNAFNLDQSSPLGPGGKGVSTFATKKKGQDYRVCVQARKKLTLYECMGSYL